MRALLQRVTRARVSVDGVVVGAVPDLGLVALIGVNHNDTAVESIALARKIANLRILRDELSLLDDLAARRAAGSAAASAEGPVIGSVDGSSVGPVVGPLDGPVAGQPASVLVISQFTLYADTRKGRRPSWNAAAPGAIAEPLVAAVVTELQAQGLVVATGRFGADMAVELVNDGPVTILVDV